MLRVGRQQIFRETAARSVRHSACLLTRNRRPLRRDPPADRSDSLGPSTRQILSVYCWFCLSLLLLIVRTEEWPSVYRSLPLVKSPQRAPSMLFSYICRDEDWRNEQHPQHMSEIIDAMKRMTLSHRPLILEAVRPSFIGCCTPHDCFDIS